MFNNYKEYKYIVITGCQRSGTRICAKCFAKDTGHKYINEEDFHTSNLYEFIELFKGEPKVIHAPAMSFLVHLLKREDVLVIFIKRDKEDILKSQKRISWDNSLEMFNYNFPDDLIDATYNYAKLQSDRVNIIEINYSSLKGHPLWVSKRNFKWNQTI